MPLDCEHLHLLTNPLSMRRPRRPPAWRFAFSNAATRRSIIGAAVEWSVLERQQQGVTSGMCASFCCAPSVSGH